MYVGAIQQNCNIMVISFTKKAETETSEKQNSCYNIHNAHKCYLNQ